MTVALNALDRHLALAGFMGAGKTTVGTAVAERLGRVFVDVDDEIERHAGRSIPDIFARDGESRFRELEEAAVEQALASAEPAVVALGGGAVTSSRTRDVLKRRAFVVLLDVDLETAWERARASDRPLAVDAEGFAALYRERRPVYESSADGRAEDVDGVLLAAAGVHVEENAVDDLSGIVPGSGPVELVVDAHVNGIHGPRVQVGLGARDLAAHEVPAGEPAKAAAVLERLWGAFGVGRDGTVVALGGGATTDVAGFAAATYKRGVAFVPVPTTLVGQVDAAIGGKTAIDIPGGKNLVGAFHWPARVVVDSSLLETLPEDELRNGMAEVVKTGLLMGEEVWERPTRELVRRCAAYKAGVCLRDPFDLGPRNVLNLGHTFAHALEAAAGYDLPHGRAVALGLLAALRLSGLEDEAATVERVLKPQRVRVDPDAAWAALRRDKKAERGAPRLVLLEAPGRPRWGVELPEPEVRRALDSLIDR